MKISRMVVWGLSLALAPMLALATSPAKEENPSTLPSRSMETPDQNTGGMSRQGGASGMEDQSGSMQRKRQQQLKDSHEPSAAMESQHQRQGVGSMNDNTTKTQQGAAEIPDQRTRDNTAPQ